MVVHSSQGVHSSLFHAATSLSTISSLLKTFVSLPFFFIPPPTSRQSIHHPHPTYFPLSLDNQSTILIQHTTPYPSTINPPSSSNILTSPRPSHSRHLFSAINYNHLRSFDERNQTNIEVRRVGTLGTLYWYWYNAKIQPKKLSGIIRIHSTCILNCSKLQICVNLTSCYQFLSIKKLSNYLF